LEEENGSLIRRKTRSWNINTKLRELTLHHILQLNYQLVLHNFFKSGESNDSRPSHLKVVSRNLVKQNHCCDITTHGMILLINNKECVDWSHNMTTKGLRHKQIWENAIRENVKNSFIQVKHVEGKCNLSDLFTKEGKDTAHFIHIGDFIICNKGDFCASLVSSRGVLSWDFLSSTTHSLKSNTHKTQIYH
jgi:hypothetical protein